MSKILDAMRKASRGGSPGDYRYQLETIEGGNLYPVPDERQLAEFEKIANILIAMHEGTVGKVVTFASTTSGEGASYVSYNIARQMAYMLERPIGWVDGNFRSPNEKLTDQKLSFRHLLQHPDDAQKLKVPGNLCVIGHGDIPLKSVNLLNSDNYPRLLTAFQQKFFFTIMDGPPIRESADLVHLAEPTDGLIVVVESRRLKHQVVRHGIDTLKAQNVDVLGTVLNKRVFDIPGFLYNKL